MNIYKVTLVLVCFLFLLFRSNFLCSSLSKATGVVIVGTIVCLIELKISDKGTIALLEAFVLLILLGLCYWNKIVTLLKR